MPGKDRGTARLQAADRAAPLAPVSFMRGHRFALKCSKRASASAAAVGAGSRSNICRTWGMTCPNTPCTPHKADGLEALPLYPLPPIPSPLESACLDIPASPQIFRTENVTGNHRITPWTPSSDMPGRLDFAHAADARIAKNATACYFQEAGN